jgi:hypothetical protein
VAKLTEATKKASTPQVSLRNHGSAGQYGYDNHPGWKLATRQALAAHNPAPYASPAGFEGQLLEGGRAPAS